MRFFERDRLGDRLSETAVDREYWRRAVDFARANPLRVVRLAAAKQLRYWKPWPSGLSGPTMVLAPAFAVFSLALLAFAFRGAIGQSAYTLAVLVGPVLYFAGLHLLFVGSPRYRLPGETLLCALAAVGICRTLGNRRGSNTPPAIEEAA